MTDEEAKTLQDELETTRIELEGLKQQKEALSRELEAMDTRIAELEQAVAEKDGEIAALKQSVDELDGCLTTVNSSLAQAVTSYRAAIIGANPGITEELVTGDTIEAIDQSLEKAKSLIAKIRQELEEEASRSKVPAGAPQRAPIDLSALSPREKIQYAIGGKR